MGTTSDDKRKHLDFIQATISRMGSNQFITRGWSITILTGIMALMINSKQYDLLWLAVIITIIFWGVDGYYLTLERAFRQLYNETILVDPGMISYSMNVEKVTINTWIKTSLTRPILSWFYGLILLLELIAIFVLKIEINIKLR